MLSTKDFRKGKRISLDGQPFVILDFQHTKVARGGATVRAKLKNLVSGSISERTFNAGENFEEPDVVTRKMQYLYESGGEYTFMDLETFEQHEIDSETLGEDRLYLKENDEYQVMLYEGNPLSVELPASVVLQIVESEPAVKGDSVSNITKPAKLESGAVVKVPLFVGEGEYVKVDTRTGEYLERVKK